MAHEALAMGKQLLITLGRHVGLDGARARLVGHEPLVELPRELLHEHAALVPGALAHRDRVGIVVVEALARELDAQLDVLRQ